MWDSWSNNWHPYPVSTVCKVLLGSLTLLLPGLFSPCQCQCCVPIDSEKSTKKVILAFLLAHHMLILPYSLYCLWPIKTIKHETQTPVTWYELWMADGTAIKTTWDIEKGLFSFKRSYSHLLLLRNSMYTFSEEFLIPTQELLFHKGMCHLWVMKFLSQILSRLYCTPAF